MWLNSTINILIAQQMELTESIYIQELKNISKKTFPNMKMYTPNNIWTFGRRWYWL